MTEPKFDANENNESSKFDANGWCSDMSLAPRDEFILVYCGEDDLVFHLYGYSSDTANIAEDPSGGGYSYLNYKPTHWNRVKPPVSTEYITEADEFLKTKEKNNE